MTWFHAACLQELATGLDGESWYCPRCQEFPDDEDMTLGIDRPNGEPL